MRAHCISRKTLKQAAKNNMRKNYGILLVVCMIAAVLGSEFPDTFNFLKIPVSATSGNGRGGGDLLEMIAVALYGETPNAEIVARLWKGDVEGARELKEKIEENNIKKMETEVLGRTHGVLATVVNEYSSGGFFVRFVEAVARLTGSATAARVSFMVLFMLFLLVFWMLVSNTYKVIQRRVFLESRIYCKTKFQRLLYCLRDKNWLKLAWCMLVKTIYELLWSLTIVAIPIKYYEYYMVPYIIVENPNLKANEAIALSREMMRGHKWECFVLNLSFLPWLILDVLSQGVTALLFTNIYRASTDAEYYVEVRGCYLSECPEAGELLNDKYLFELAGTEALEEAYSDVREKLMELQGDTEDREDDDSVGFFTKMFSVVLMYNERENQYERAREQRFVLQDAQKVLAREVYPARLHPEIQVKERGKQVERLHYLRHYSVLTLILMFFIMCVFGWVYEVIFHLIYDGMFVNRGMLHGPWIPLYGAGGIMILLLLNRFRKHPIVEFFSAMVLCGVVEYITAYAVETMNPGVKWWDYSGYFLNIQGRCCAEGLFIFGVVGVAFVYLLAPLIDNFLRKVPAHILLPVSVVLVLAFGLDIAYSARHPNIGEGITYTDGTPVQDEKKVVQNMEEKWNLSFKWPDAPA